jgi:hypothetical protein
MHSSVLAEKVLVWAGENASKLRHLEGGENILESVICCHGVIDYMTIGQNVQTHQCTLSCSYNVLVGIPVWLKPHIRFIRSS